MQESEIEDIARRVSKKDTKLLGPGLLFTMLITAAGWIWSAAIQSKDVHDNKVDIKEISSQVSSVPVLARDVQHNAMLIDGNKEILKEHGAQLKDIQRGQTEIKVLIESLRPK